MVERVPCEQTWKLHCQNFSATQWIVKPTRTWHAYEADVSGKTHLLYNLYDVHFQQSNQRKMILNSKSRKSSMPPYKTLKELPPQPELPDETLSFMEWSEDALRESIAAMKAKIAAHIGHQEESTDHSPIGIASEHPRDTTIKILQKDIKRQHKLMREVYAGYTLVDFAAMPKETLEASMKDVERMVVVDSKALTRGEGEKDADEEGQECKGSQSGRPTTLPFGAKMPRTYNDLYPRVTDAIMAKWPSNAGPTPPHQASTTDDSTSGPVKGGWSRTELTTIIPIETNVSGSTEPEELEAGIDGLKAQLRALGAERAGRRKRKKKSAVRKKRSGG